VKLILMIFNEKKINPVIILFFIVVNNIIINIKIALIKMELLIPAFALGSLYVINKKNKPFEKMTNYNANSLPNTDIPNRNFPNEFPIVLEDLDQTSKLSVQNKYSSVNGAYTDKYFMPSTYSSDDSQSQPVYKSLTGLDVGSEYFKHNNMSPYFGGKIRTNHTMDNVNESILDSYSGSGSQIIKKTETKPLFQPHNNTQWSYGTPNTSDFMQSRVNPSKNMANVKPFADIKVGPGLGLGYTAEGSGGYNSGMGMRDCWIDPTVDQLRVLTKPKSSGIGMLGHEGPANHHIKERGNLGIQEKQRPDTFFEMGPERYMTTTCAEKGPAVIPETILKDVARPETTASYQGVANSNNNAQYVVGEYREPHTVENGSYPILPAYAGGKGDANENDYQHLTTNAYNNNRTVNSKQDYFGVVRGYVNETMAPLLDVLKPSRKQNAIGTARPYENPKSAVNKSYLFNPNDKTKITMRQTTERSQQGYLYVNRNERGNGGGYTTNPHQPVDNERMTTTDFFYSGGSGAVAGSKQTRSYDAEYNQRNNDLKSSTLVGYTPAGKMDTFNSAIQMKTSSQRDQLTQNRRDGVPYFGNQTPDTRLMGEYSASTGLYSKTSLDRNNGDILGQLTDNPYVIRAF